MNGKEVIKILRANGFDIKSIHGSHYKLQKENLKVIVPVHGKRDIKIGTLQSIQKDSDIKLAK